MKSNVDVINYMTVEQACAASGLRLVVTKGAPGPWSESAKAILDLKGVVYSAVPHIGGMENQEIPHLDRAKLRAGSNV